MGCSQHSVLFQSWPVGLRSGLCPGRSKSSTPALPNYVGVLSCWNIPGSTAYEDILYTSMLQFGRLSEDIMCCGHLNIDVLSLTIATIPHETWNRKYDMSNQLLGMQNHGWISSTPLDAPGFVRIKHQTTFFKRARGLEIRRWTLPSLKTAFPSHQAGTNMFKNDIRFTETSSQY